MKKTYIIPAFTETEVAAQHVIAGSFRGQLGTEEMSGEEVLVKEDIFGSSQGSSFWEDE